MATLQRQTSKEQLLSAPEDAKMSTIKKGSGKKNSQINIKQLIVERKKFIKKQKLEIESLEKLIQPKEQKLRLLEEICDMKRTCMEESLEAMRRKPGECKVLIEKACKDKEEAEAAITKLFEDRRILDKELKDIDEILCRYKWFRDILFKLSSSEWQESLEAKASGAEDVSKQTSESEDTEREGSSPSSFRTDTGSTLSETEDDEKEGKLDTYFSDPHQVLDVMMELTDQVLSLIRNSTAPDKTLEETIEITKQKIQEDDEKLSAQVNDMKERIKEEVRSATRLKTMVKVHESIKTEDQDLLLSSLAKKVRDVYSTCADRQITTLSSLKMLCSIERRMTLLMQQIDNIPEEMCRALWHIKENERKTRRREEKIRLEREKQREKQMKCQHRLEGEITKHTGRKLLPRSMLVKQVVTTEEPVAAVAEADPYAEFFSEDH